ncbi:hypothetical protein WM40_22315 [Robbsia andropogonis]|uniref:Bacterial transcriptional activator domain-containing protein n=1 Tax=Robbsia andropogonis TaxID=28092 RepID=A0A0F5JUS7_9BURK|nr:tetratricopeptide repeat protein [Robbsia andropogonis]KKB61603.1 hypothetical protein WM40_22315 [Robbsia andropogonis]MCP1120066.1 tetratricopeptide repeat protein [Robbsia andropogonis]MCP1129875.1 tetratricopeptide repeat protein [Robbsia andropogonis]
MSDALLAAALDAHRRGQCDLAAEHYDALSTNSTLPTRLRADAFYWRGVLALQQAAPATMHRERDRAPSTKPIDLLNIALRAFDAALALHPAHPAAHLNRGHVYRQQANRDAARSAYTTAIALCGIPLSGLKIANPAWNNDAARHHKTRESDAPSASTAPDATTSAINAAPPLPSDADTPRSAAPDRNVAAAALSALGSLQMEDAGEGVADRFGTLLHALSCFDMALQCTTAAAATHDQRGLVLAALGRYADAETAHRNALARQPGHPGFINNIGVALKAQGQLDAAAAAFRDALRITPAFVPALINLGQTVALQGEYDQATAPLLRAAQLAPDLDLVHCELAQAFLAQGVHDAALHHAERAVAVAPHGPIGWQNLGAARFENGDSTGAAKAFDRVIALTPLPARVAAAVSLQGQASADLQRAVAYHDGTDPAVALAPVYALARFSRACLLLSDGGSPAGWRHFEARLALRAGDRRVAAPMGADGRPLPRWLGEPVSQHRMPVPARRGAKGTGQVSDAHSATQPQPSDPDTEACYMRLPGRTLLVLAEQGYGDTMQFLRFIGCLTARGANVVLALQPALRPLLAHNGAAIDSMRTRRLTVITRDVDTPPPNVDAYCHIGSIPACLRLGRLPRPGDAGTWTTPYLFAERAAPQVDTATHAALPGREADTAPSRGALAKTVLLRGTKAGAMQTALVPAQPRKIGFAWSGRRPNSAASPSRDDEDNAPVRFDKRAIPLDELAPLLYQANTEWHPLQTDIRDDEYALLDALSAHARIVVPERPAEDFAITAQRIAALDHVVTIDTSIAHLAGAMGKPTTLLLSCVADWRWCGSRTQENRSGSDAGTTGIPDTSLWYPSIRIVRQPRNGDWHTVIEHVAALLEQDRPEVLRAS